MGNQFLMSWVHVPMEVYANKKLTPLTKFLYTFIQNFDGAEGCKINNATFAEYTLSTAVSVHNCITRLEKEKYIRCTYHNGQRTIKCLPFSAEHTNIKNSYMS